MATPDPVGRYARAVVAGKIPASIIHRWACERHLRDLKTAKRRGLHFDRKLAMRAITFFPLMRHFKGALRGQPFVLELWQQFIVGSIFGWRRADGRRRFELAYIEIPRKNGKSTLIAGIAILVTFFEGEGGAEGYCAATKKDQAKIVFNMAGTMVRHSPELRPLLLRRKLSISSAQTDSTLEPLGADADTLDGLNPSFVCIDELHAHPTSAVVDVMETGMGARRDPLQVEITTAGFDQNSICWKHRELSRRILDVNDEHAEDDTWFAFIAGVDQGDDWREEATWIKANPNYGVSVLPDKMAKAAKRAEMVFSAQVAFRQKNLNEWLSNAERAIDMALWDQGKEPFDLEGLKGRRCYGGMDLARQRDLSAFVLVFPPESKGERWKVLGWYWIPDDDIELRSKRDQAPYVEWTNAYERGDVARPLIEATPGGTTDYDFIEQRILELAGVYDIAEIAFDRTFAATIVAHLEAEGLTMVQFGQGYVDMGHPTDEMLRMVLGLELQHGGDPVLRWAAANLVVVKGPAGTVKPDKQKSREKIDPMVALIMAIGRAMVRTPKKRSKYESGGLFSA